MQYKLFPEHRNCYNAKLFEEKEVEIKIDMESMQKMMKKCSMSGKMKSEGTSTGETMPPQSSGQEVPH